MKRTRKIAAVLIAVGLILGGRILSAEENEWRFKYSAGDGLKMGDGKNLVQIQGRVQGRFTYDGRDQAADTDSFAIQRGKIKIDGPLGPGT